MGHKETRRQAKQLMTEKQYPEAKALFQQAAKEEGLPLPEWLDESDALLQEGNVPEATRVYMQAIRADPTEVRALVGAARCAIAIQQPEQAGQLVNAALSLEPDHGIALTLRGILYELKGEHQKAIPFLEKGYENSPGIFLCAYNYGRVLSQLEQTQKAISILLKASQIQPESYDVHYLLGIVYVQSGHAKRALESFHQAAKISPKRINIYSTLADVYTQMGEVEQALTCLKEALQELGPQAKICHKMADLLNNVGQHVEAMDYLKQSIELAPEIPSSWISLTQTYTILGKYLEAEETADKALKLSPNSWEAHSAQGGLYSATEEWDKAENSFRKATKLAPEQFSILGNLAALLIEKGTDPALHEAVDLLQRATNLVPAGEYRFHFNLALAYTRLGNPTARPLLEEIIQETPKDSTLHKAALGLKENTVWG